MARENDWNTFENPWKEILERWKIPFPFHATDFFSEHRRDKKLKHITRDLVRTIANHIEAAFSVGLDMQAYKLINQDHRLEEMSGAPISVVSRALRVNVDSWRAAVGDVSPILYYIEKGTYQYGDMTDCWKYLDGLDPPIPVRKEHPAAQAADLYAYSVYQSAPFIVPSWQHKIFADTLRPRKLAHFDARIMESDLRADLARDKAVVNGVKVRIPDRKVTAHLNFEFARNKNKKQAIRRAKTGIDK